MGCSEFQVAGKFNTGNGGLCHVNILKMAMSDKDWEEKLPPAIREIFTEVVKLGGTISGEHGIGTEKLKEMSFVFSKNDIEFMRSIKKAFDPNEIWNPGKVIPPAQA